MPSLLYISISSIFFSSAIFLYYVSLLTFLTDRFSMCSCRVPVDEGCPVLSFSAGTQEKAAHRISMAVAVSEGLSASEKQNSKALL